MSEDLKQIAAIAAADAVGDGMVVGLGTGSTASHAIRRLGERVRGEGISLRGIPTSVASEQLAIACGLTLTSFDDVAAIDFAIDGADEVDAAGHLIKGGGGALLREKVVAARAAHVAIVCDPDKLVERLGRAFRLPVEVVPFAWRPCRDAIAALPGGGVREITLRGGRSQPFVTDNGNWVLDVAFGDGIADAPRLEAELARIPGIVESGLFVGLVDEVVIGYPDGPQRRRVPRAR